MISRIGWKPTIRLPSCDTFGPIIQVLAVASLMKLLRAFAMRNISVGTPLCGATTGYRAKMSRARGREMRAKTRPVIIASSIMPMKFSVVATIWP